MPHLTIRESSGERVHRIEGDAVTLGRASTNTVPIHEAGASKEHCRIERVGERWKVVDLESKNGTRVNGRTRNKAWLEHGDRIEIGRTEIRFAREGGARAAGAARAGTGTGAGTGAGASRAAAGGDAERPPPRRPRRGNENIMVGVLATLGTVVVALVGYWAWSALAPDEYNETVLRRARELKANDQWLEALEYAQVNADPSGNMYPKVQRFIRELQARKDVFYRNRRNEEARTLYSRMTRRIQAYDRGSPDITAEEVLSYIQRLKTDFADTEYAETARAEYPAWFRGRAPQRAIEILEGGTGSLEEEWAEAKRRSRDLENDWQFREARETVERFLTIREISMSDAQVEHYESEIARVRKHLELAAQNTWFGLERRVNGLVRQGRYEEAIEQYRRAMRRFGLDEYTSKAQAAIDELERQKAAGG